MRNLLLLFIILMRVIAVAQNGIPITGFQSMLPLYNPAAVGANEGTEIALLDKVQWSSLPVAPRLTALSINTPLNYERLGMGLTMVRESFGVQNLVTLNGLFSYKINIAKGRLSFGMRTGFVQWNQNFNDLKIKDQNEVIVGEKKTSLDFGGGLFYKNKNQSLGVSLNYKPSIYFGVNRPAKFYYNFSWERKVKLSNTFNLKPAILISYTYRFPALIAFSVPIEYKGFLWTGVSYRSTSLISFMAGINIHKLLKDDHTRITLFYYFDYSATKLNLGNSHEFILSFNPGKNRNIERIKRKRVTVSPLFFD